MPAVLLLACCSVQHPNCCLAGAHTNYQDSDDDRRIVKRKQLSPTHTPQFLHFYDHFLISELMSDFTVTRVKAG